MIDKMLGSDEELRETAKNHRGGEVVTLDTEADPTEVGGNTVNASAARNIEQTTGDEEGDDSSCYDEEDDYIDDFHEILEEVVRHQADMEEDRDDDLDLNESDVSVPSIAEEESKSSVADEPRENPHDSKTESVSKKRSINPTSS